MPGHVRRYLEPLIKEVIEREHLEKDTGYAKCEYPVGVGVDEKVEGIKILLAGRKLEALSDAAIIGVYAHELAHSHEVYRYGPYTNPSFKEGLTGFPDAIPEGEADFQQQMDQKATEWSFSAEIRAMRSEIDFVEDGGQLP